MWSAVLIFNASCLFCHQAQLDKLLMYKCILYIFFVVYSVNDRYKIHRKKL